MSNNKHGEMKISFCFVPSILKEFHKKKTNTTGVLPIWQDQPKQIMGNYEEALHIILKKVNKRRGIFQRQSVRKVARLKSLSSGRTYTSRVCLRTISSISCSH
jgi:hypothetical protein